MTNDDVRRANVGAAHAFLDRLSEKDMDAWATLWADDAVQEMPFAPAGFPRRVVGKAALVRHYANLPATSGRMVFLDRVERPMLDPSEVLLEYRGEIELIEVGRRYDNRYAGLFAFDGDGLITLFREYFDPTVLAEAWGDALGDGYNLTTEEGESR